MWRKILSLLVLSISAAAAAAPPSPESRPVTPPAAPPAPVAAQPKTAPNRVTHVTVYPNNALVTREVDAPEDTGLFELVVTPLPPRTVDSSLYSEGTDTIRVLTTRFRMRPIKEDTREEVRKLEAHLRELLLAGQKLQSDVHVIEQNLQMLTKLETFTGANLQHQTEKGNLNGEAIITLTKYVMDTRAEKAQQLVGLQQQLQTNKEQVEFTQRQLRDLSAGSSRTERDAVIVVDKPKAGPGKVRLNYLVDAAAWKPQYKLRAGKDNGPVQVEYLAAVSQQTGEDWGQVQLTLSTAQPLLSAAPPSLWSLEVTVGQGGEMNPAMVKELEKQALGLRSQARQEYNAKKGESGGQLMNSAAALEQARDLLALKDEEIRKGGPPTSEGPSITYHLATPLSVPSRHDEQVLEVARLEMVPEYYYKAVPVLSPHVYRLANLTNKSPYVLLPGEATMYLGADFVGRANLPLVAVGERFRAGFGVEPQLQVQRQLLDKTRTTQGNNWVLRYEYRILISSYKTEPVKVQVWDRLPHSQTEAVGVTLVQTKPELSTDPVYLRESRPQNLLRWDLTVEPATNAEKAVPVSYEFKLEMGRETTIKQFMPADQMN
jgi:uncharacterized protein (TIGR02231 family)